MRLNEDEVNTLALTLERLPTPNSRQRALTLRVRRYFRNRWSRRKKEIVFEPDLRYLDDDLLDKHEEETGATR